MIEARVRAPAVRVTRSEASGIFVGCCMLCVSVCATRTGLWSVRSRV